MDSAAMVIDLSPLLTSSQTTGFPTKVHHARAQGCLQMQNSPVILPQTSGVRKGWSSFCLRVALLVADTWPKMKQGPRTLSCGCKMTLVRVRNDQLSSFLFQDSVAGIQNPSFGRHQQHRIGSSADGVAANSRLRPYLCGADNRW